MRPFSDRRWLDRSLARRVVVEYHRHTHKSAEAVIPGLSRLQHYADWLERHPPAFIRSKERLDEK